MRSLVILPGWGHGRESWEPLVANFAPRVVHIMELPGFGRQPRIKRARNVPGYALWVRERLYALGLKEFDILGHSLGGRVAAFLAAEGVSGLGALVLYGAPVLYRPSFSVRARSRVAKAFKPLISPFISATKLIGGELAEAEARGMGDVFRNVVTFDQTDLLPQIQAPALLLWGEQDKVVSIDIAKEAQGLITKSELAFLPGLGHNAHLENPVLFCGTVSRFLERHA